MTKAIVSEIADFMCASPVTTAEEVAAQLQLVAERWPTASDAVVEAAMDEVVQRQTAKGHALHAEADALDALAAIPREARPVVIAFTDAERTSFSKAIAWGMAAAVEQAVTDFIKVHRGREDDRAALVLIAMATVAKGCDQAALRPFVEEWERLCQDDPDRRYAS